MELKELRGLPVKEDAVTRDFFRRSLEHSTRGAVKRDRELAFRIDQQQTEMPLYYSVMDIADLTGMSTAPGSVYFVQNAGAFYYYNTATLAFEPVASGAGGGDAETLDGLDSTAFALAGHTHGAPSLVNDSVTNAILDNMASATVKGQIVGGSGDPVDLTATQLNAIIGTTDLIVPTITANGAANSGIYWGQRSTTTPAGAWYSDAAGINRLYDSFLSTDRIILTADVIDFRLNYNMQAKFGLPDWGLRIGNVSAGHQFIAMGVKKMAADNNYYAESANNALVNHGLLQFGYDGSFRYYYQAHVADDTLLSMQQLFGVSSTLFDVNVPFAANYDADVTSYVGRAAIGYTGHSDYASLSHVDNNNATDFGFLQGAAGDSFVNGKTGRSVYLRINNNNIMQLSTGFSQITGALATTGDFSVGGDLGAWGGISFGSGWANYGSGWQTGEVRKFGCLIQLRGLVYRFTGTGTTICTLAIGQRPPANVLLSVITDSGIGRIDVQTDGNVVHQSGGTTWVSLSSAAPFSIKA
jgi:hypothetical protein